MSTWADALSPDASTAFLRGVGGSHPFSSQLASLPVHKFPWMAFLRIHQSENQFPAPSNSPAHFRPGSCDHSGISHSILTTERWPSTREPRLHHSIPPQRDANHAHPGRNLIGTTNPVAFIHRAESARWSRHHFGKLQSIGVLRRARVSIYCPSFSSLCVVSTRTVLNRHLPAGRLASCASARS